MTKIIIDSTTDLPKDIIDRYDIDILPLRIYINGREYLDKFTICVSDVYKEMKNGILPQTSLPNPKNIYELFEKYASKGKDFIFYSFSSKLSSTYETSYLIIKELKKKFPDVNMGIIDTKGGSLGSGLIALQGALAAKKGESFDNIIKNSKQASENIEHIFSINDLSWLLKGGRISKSSEIIGRTLNIKPILEVRDGKMEVVKKARGRKKMLNTVLDMVENRIEEFPEQIIGIAHADDLKTALKMKDMIEKRIECKNGILIEKIGSVLGSHLGIGGVGVLFFNREPDLYISNLELI